MPERPKRAPPCPIFFSQRAPPNPAHLRTQLWRLLEYLTCRLDSLVGLFAAKCAPTATADPYGLRRAAVGMLQVRPLRCARLRALPRLPSLLHLSPQQGSPWTFTQ